MINPLSNPAYLLPALIALCVIIGLLVLMWCKSPRDFSNALFGGFLLGLGLWSFLLFGMRSSPDINHALLWEKALIVTGGLAFMLYYHFTLVYARIRPKRWTLPVIYSVIVVLAIIVATTDLAISGMYLESYGYAPIKGPLLFLFFMPAPLLIVGGAYNLYKRFRLLSSSEERNRLLYLIIATVFPLAGVALDAFSDLPPASLWGNLIFCAVCSFAILKYHLLGIRVIVRKSLAYLLVSFTVAAPYVIILLLLVYILKTQLEPWWVHAFIVLLLAILLRPVYSRAQLTVDKMFYRERYDYLKALEQFSQRAQSIVDLEELSSNIVQLICGALRASSAYLLLASDNIGGFRVASYSGLDNACPSVVLRNQSPLIKWIRINQRILAIRELSIIPQLRNLSLWEKNNLKQIKANLFVPIQTSMGQLSGILVLGQKLSQQPYSTEDKQLLIAISNQISTNLENARLYRKSQQEVEDRKRAEDKIRASEERYRHLFENLNDAAFLTDAKTGEILDTNRQGEVLTGMSRNEIIGMHQSALHPLEKSEEYKQRFTAHVAKGRAGDYEGEVIRKDGAIIPVYISASPLIIDGRRLILGLFKDTTERKQAEEREKKLQKELYLSSRLASIGELAAGVAHQINNPLTGVLGFSQRLLRKSSDHEVKQDLERIYSEAERAAKVVQNLLTFARRRQPNKQYVDVNDILQSALELRAYELKTSNIELIADLAPSLHRIMVDFHQIQEAFLNIILNAEQAMIEEKGRGRLTIKTREKNGYMRITFSDDGPGIAAEHLDKIFDPFFSTKGKRGGTGLGLSVCHGIITEHGGRIYVRSKLGTGATFFVELPIKAEE